MNLPPFILACPATLALIVRAKVTGELPGTTFYDAWEALEDPDSYNPSDEVRIWVHEQWNQHLCTVTPWVNVAEVAPHTPARPWMPLFLEKFALRGIVTVAAAAAGIDPRTVYRHCEHNPVFAAMMEEAGRVAADALEAEAWRRAVEGTTEPLIGRVAKDEDGEVGSVQKYSDTLMLSLLKARRPEKFREKRGDTNVSIQATASANASASSTTAITPERAADLQARKQRQLQKQAERAVKTNVNGNN